MKLSEMKQILARSNIRLSKSLGQNFLHDGNQLRRIVAAGELTAADRVLEIGPGLGPLTDWLVAQAGSVLAVEKDRRLLDVLRQRFCGEGIDATRGHRRLPPPQPNPASELTKSREERPPLLDFQRAKPSGATVRPEYRAGTSLPVSQGETQLENSLDSMPVGTGLGPPIRTKLLLLHDDALKFLRRESSDWSDWKMVSNLPYSVASPILVELAQARGCPERMVATVQREVAQRIVANPGDENYGLLSLLIQLRYEPRGWFKVPANCFFPRPEVDSACVTLLRRSKPLLNQEQAGTFARIVKRAFSQRRKMMLKLLRKDWSPVQLTAAWEYLELPPSARAEQVSLEQFVSLTNLLASD